MCVNSLRKILNLPKIEKMFPEHLIINFPVNDSNKFPNKIASTLIFYSSNKGSFMQKQHQVHNLIILDESGSMESIKDTIISGFNELVQTISGMESKFPDQKHFITFVTFNGLAQKILHYMEPANLLKEINTKKYNPQASTPLYDAMGMIIKKLDLSLQDKTDYNVLVTILTDGEENASEEYSGKAIKKLVEDLKQKNWTFTYIGTDHDVENFAFSISIENTMVFQKDIEGTRDMFAKERKARENYSHKLYANRTVSDNYFDDIDEESQAK